MRCERQHPEKLNGKLGECTLEQIKECDGDQERPCDKEPGKK